MFAIKQKHIDILLRAPESGTSPKYGVTFYQIPDCDVCCDLEGAGLLQLHRGGGVVYDDVDSEILGHEVGRRDTWTRTLSGDAMVRALITRAQELL